MYCYVVLCTRPLPPQFWMYCITSAVMQYIQSWEGSDLVHVHETNHHHGMNVEPIVKVRLQRKIELVVNHNQLNCARSG